MLRVAPHPPVPVLEAASTHRRVAQRAWQRADRLSLWLPRLEECRSVEGAVLLSAVTVPAAHSAFPAGPWPLVLHMLHPGGELPQRHRGDTDVPCVVGSH